MSGSHRAPALTPGFRGGAGGGSGAPGTVCGRPDRQGSRVEPQRSRSRALLQPGRAALPSNRPGLRGHEAASPTSTHGRTPGPLLLPFGPAPRGSRLTPVPVCAWPCTCPLWARALPRPWLAFTAPAGPVLGLGSLTGHPGPPTPFPAESDRLGETTTGSTCIVKDCGLGFFIHVEEVFEIFKQQGDVIRSLFSETLFVLQRVD